MILSDNARRLETGTITSLTETGVPSEEEVLSLASQLRKIPIYSVSDAEFELVIRRLHQALRIDMGVGSRIADEYAPWLQARKPQIEPYYWKRYQLDLRKQGWAPKVVNALDNVTDDILDLSGNPATDSGWPRRGLVMGDVQSGKTSNYTGLICKAADAGYRLVILLTGTLETLRRQTQERLDAGFVGLDSSGVVTRNRQRREIGVGLVNSARAAGVFTSTLVDFRAATVNQLGFRLDAFNEPVLLVVKKHKRILENLTEWLRNYNAGTHGQIELPMLLIDDEADNASVNTRPDRATAINAAIRSLLRIFPRSTYMGFTATPFANVFIHPDSREEMLGDDLFPRDFVFALDAPSNYLSARKIFGDDSAFDCLRSINDAEVSLPRGHRANHQVDELSNSLLDAVRTFVVANAIMDLRPDTPKHRSMLVNVSHYTEVQNQVRDLIDEFVRQMQEDIRNYAGLSKSEALKNKSIGPLHDVFNIQFGDTGIEWAEVQRALPSAALPIEVRSVNQKSGAASLAYGQYAQHGLRVIAVGGNSLSRGLTLEGLCVSYFYRSTQMYDTLLQMGRWFGYRPNYEDLVRIWMTDEAVNWYAHIAEAAEELRGEIRHMQTSHLRPIDFGMKVRAHPDSLLITARNKMRNSSEITRFISISAEGLETPRLLADQAIIAANYRAAVQFIDRIIQSGAGQTANSNPLWQGVDKRLVVELLRSFVVHPLNVAFHPEDLANFLERSDDPLLAKWDVVIPNGASQPLEVTSGISIRLQGRKLAINTERRSILVNERKMRVGSRGVEREGMSINQIEAAERDFRGDPENAGKDNVPDRAYRLYRARPLLILHFLDGTVDGQPYRVPEKAALTALGLSFPKLAGQSERVTYRINLVEIRNLLAEESSEAEEEEADDDDED
jgi:hypothetical protein